jgi:septum formation protein
MLLKDKHVILASGSPRRIDILRKDGVDFESILPKCNEEIALNLSPKQTVMALALRKALSIGERDGLILACDTVVVHDGKIIGKPKDEADAKRILTELNGKKHKVISGVAIIQKIPKITLVFSDETVVYFKCYSEADIDSYIATGEPMDKAGAYAIQGGFKKYIDHIEGDYDNVVGFPYEKIKDILSYL